MAVPLSARDLSAFAAALRRRVRGEVAFDAGTRALYSTGACIYRVPPLAVVAPLDAADVQAAMATCRAHNVPVTPRGAGSGLVGQALGDGLVLDFTVHMNRLLSLGEAHAWVQPGMAGDALNAAVAPRGLWFPPDPSSSGYCSVGGMVANNSSGSHSVKYGAVIDYVEELDVVLSDGTTARLRAYELGGAAWQCLTAQETREAQVHRDAAFIAERHAALIRQHQPRTAKNSAGYRLERVIENGVLNLSKLVCGSEGTLAVVVAARLRLAPRPAARREALLHFPDLASAGRATLELLAFGPSAIEIHEAHAAGVIRACRPELADLLPHPGESQLHVEFDGASEAEAADALARARKRICSELHLASRWAEPASPEEARRLWAIRKATLPILYNQPGPRRITPFIEDVAVPPEQMPPFIERLQAIFARHGVQAAIYGHASQGNFHIRPLLDLHDPSDLARMRAVADEVFALTIALGGTTSGEHGDGMARTEYLPKLYGPLTLLFGAIKRVFDPENLLNPGKKVPDPRRGFSLTRHLRFEASREGACSPPAILHWSDVGLAQEAERCHGCGSCRTRAVGWASASPERMCPVFRALGVEAASPRAKANVLREVAVGRLAGDDAAAALAAVSDLCLLCGSCKADCPSRVNVPKLILEARARLGPRGRLMARLDALSPLAAQVALVANAANRFKPFRWALEKLAGLHRNAPLPPVTRRPLQARISDFGFQIADSRPKSPERPAGQSAICNLKSEIVYFPDTFAEYSDPTIGLALIRLLHAAGIRAVVPKVRSCGIVAMCSGNAAGARKAIRHNLAQLRGYARDGLDILVTEPTAYLCLREAYGDFVPGDEAREVAARTHDALDYLLALRRGGRLALPLGEVSLTLARHVPCHARVAGLGAAAEALLGEVPGLSLVALPDGCCGIAGSAGMCRAKYPLAMQIGAPLFEGIRAEGIQGSVSECSACRLQLEHGSGKPSYHPLHLLAHAALGEPGV